MRMLLLPSCVFAFMVTATPAYADTVLRHLDYRVAVRSTATVTTESYDGTSSGMANGGFQGTIGVDVLNLYADGGMTVRSTIKIDTEPRASQPATCAVYGDGRVLCAPEARITVAEHVLLSHLGRNFYDRSIVDANGKWTRDEGGEAMTDHADFTSKTTTTPNVYDIDEHRRLQVKKTLGAGFHSDTHLQYNVALSVPLTIHDENIPDGRSGSGGITITDLNLTSDSFKKP